MLTELVALNGKKGALWPVCSDGVEECGSVCRRREACTRGFGKGVAEDKHAQLVQALNNFSNVYFMMGATRTAST